ncbi:MAG: DUF4126 domain-containing protein [Bacteroidia bacterium]|nr:DUF4126 domain-containing protein [Bacteroidia bacterium]NNJ55759.1 DUF4126 domain-containing protein [Bacteroidia bacterium]
MDGTLILSVLLGLGLSSAVGFRVFLPVLLTSVAAYLDQVQLAESMMWLGSLPAMITFAVATVMEILGYYIPFFDNLLDTIATPAAVLCGSLLMGSTIVDMEPLVKWPVSIIAGGGIAGTIKGSSSILRVKSSGLTAGTANPILTTVETVVSGIISVLSILVPILAVVILVYLIYYFIIKKKVRT